MKKAFTLAEVLITLGIIGIVAAMTMPTLISNYQKQVYVNQLKKSVSVLEQGFKKILADEEADKLSDTLIFSNANGCITTDYNNTPACTKFYDDLKNYFKILDINYVDNFYGKFLWTDDKDDISFNYLKLVDGTFISLGLNYPDKIANNTVIGDITIDINGLKKPNTHCRDIFTFYLLANGHLTSNPAEDFNRYPSGEGCEAHLMQNAWKMDY